MPNQEARPERQSGALAINQLTFSELEANVDLRDSLLQLYCNVFNAPPWNDNWVPEEVASLMDKHLKPDGTLTIALREGRPIGFMWGYVGTLDYVVPESVETYLNLDYDDKTRSLIIEQVTEALTAQSSPETLFNHCEIAVDSKEQGRVGGLLLVTAITDVLASGQIEWMYGITSMESSFYRIVQSRGAILLCSLSDYEPIRDINDTRVIMAMDMKNLLPGAKKRLY